MAGSHVHLIGIGGTAMTAVAGLLKESGCVVTGSDGKLYPPTSTVLGELGLQVFQGFDAAHLRPRPDLVVVGNAISRGNPELEYVLDERIEYTSMARLIHDRFLPDRHSIVVAGTHGKTTTTSMLAWVLHHAGMDPGFLIGGAPQNFDRPFRLGKGRPFVIEGDEYDTAFFDKGPKFMHYRPDTAMLGTVEFDHADIYRDLDHVRQVFRRLVLLIPRRGLLVCNQGDAIASEVSRDAPCRVEGYGGTEGRWQAHDVQPDGDGTSFRLDRDGQMFAEIHLPMVGMHNVRNATAVAVACADLGVDGVTVASGLASFTGVRRRLEQRGESDGIRVFDDFAHHPTAIEETLTAVRRQHPDGRVWAVVEPRSWSLRRNVFQQRLVGAFDAADRVLLAPVFRADQIDETERLDTARLVSDLAARGVSATATHDIATIVETVGREARTGDVVVVMSNGGFENIHERLLDSIAQSTAASETAR
ncbi:MAG: UDP-N-acetylmuramate:L-alanyl-gamma-D-glutamyl-meso-diaminopimelate ligase [Acidobacteriota bacterium]|nr:UDP-N-acetylmuramate:L-alanyl-gamma-D-glutamyl-meso-diaminopimelate ligase [Acidobacteriota bacterium]MDH3786192.1 UDP-N-acetylmuramate:L-alanyl-gamma-D-glutamyl-meso-diaminopimelate ligase [Acidobacteriota bacterium]